MQSPISFLCILSACAPFVFAADEEPQAASRSLTGTIAVSTRYLSRGLEVSEGPPVPQAGFEYLDSTGIYSDGYSAKIRYFGMNAEIDNNQGYRGQNGRLNYDLGIYYYHYPGADHALHSNFGELGMKLSWGKTMVTPVVEMYVSNNYFFGAGKSPTVPDAP